MTTRDIPFREVPYLPQRLEVERTPGNVVYLRNGQPLKPYPPHMLAPLVHWAENRPGATWLAQRDPVDPSRQGWQTLSYGDALRHIRNLAQAFLDRGAGAQAPVMILSRNAIEHALVMYAAMWAGSPVVPVTPAYALLAEDFTRLNHIDRLTAPKIVYVEDGAQYQRGLDGMDLAGRPVVYARNAPDVERPVALAELMETRASAEVDAAYDRLGPATIAKYMMTSGSTGEPKAVINTHEMIAANAKMIRSVWDEARLDAITSRTATRELPGQVMCNFLPWSHTYGANAILHNMTDWGGALFIDWGAPTPARLPEMLRNLREIATTQHTTVPAAWAALATELEHDRTLAETFFSRLLVMAYGGAAMGQDIYERIQAVAVEVTGERISLSAGYGATETAPTASNVHWPNDTMGLIGLPLPGNTFKLVPCGQKTELRVKGVNVTPGYHNMPDKTAEAFDEEGYYRLGDAVRFVDPDDPNRGLAFDGRTAEEFKLSSGTWVSAGTVRVQVVAAVDGALADVVVCGLNEDRICLLGFLHEGWCRRQAGADLGLEELVEHPKIRDAIRAGIERHNAAHPNPANRIARLCLQTAPPRPDAGEITEKGYINQARARELRADDISALYSNRNSPRILNFE